MDPELLPSKTAEDVERFPSSSTPSGSPEEKCGHGIITDTIKNIEDLFTKPISPAFKLSMNKYCRDMKPNEKPLPYTPPVGPIPKKGYYIEVIKDGSVVKKIDFPATKSYLLFGRESRCDIMAENPSVSRFHAVLQYGCYLDETQGQEELKKTEGQNFYLMDLGGSNRTFKNKTPIKARIYVKIEVGEMFRFGFSKRLYLFCGPVKVSEETWISETERKHLVLSKPGTVTESRKKSDSCDWGLGWEESGNEEVDLTENPFAVTNNEELYLEDPKKTLRGWFEREGEELEYSCDRENDNRKFICVVKLPIGGQTVLAEAKSEKKKEAVVQCALESCRILDRYGLLFTATHESRKKVSKNWEADDYYDSDDDTFLDRTGEVEMKRQKRMEMAGVKETYSSLLIKHNDIVANIKSKQCKLDEENLDKYVASQIKRDIKDLLLKKSKLQTLLEITRPVELPKN